MDTILSRRALGWHPVAVKPESDPQATPPGLRVVCAWCDKVLLVGGPASKTTHGICQRCKAAALAEDAQ